MSATDSTSGERACPIPSRLNSHLPSDTNMKWRVQVESVSGSVSSWTEVYPSGTVKRTPSPSHCHVCSVSTSPLSRVIRMEREVRYPSSSRVARAAAAMRQKAAYSPLRYRTLSHEKSPRSAWTAPQRMAPVATTNRPPASVK